MTFDTLLPRRARRLAVTLAIAAVIAGCSSPNRNAGRAPQQDQIRTADAPRIPIPARARKVEPAPIAPPPGGVASRDPVADAFTKNPTPDPYAAAPAPAAAWRGAAAPSSAAGSSGAVHIVQRGDTVFSIARRYGSTPAAIQSANRLDRAFTIQPGQRLTIPGAARAAAPTLTPVAPTRPTAPRLAPAAPVQPATPTRMIRPVQGPIVGVFGQTAGSARNNGVDIAAPAGSLVRAAATGEVIYVSAPHPEVGSVVLIRHAGGLLTVYGLIDNIVVRKGQRVAQGAPLAAVAAPKKQGGRSMLHFELRRGTQPIDPTPYLRAGVR